jgi:hypothetical protein
MIASKEWRAGTVLASIPKGSVDGEGRLGRR